MNVQLNQLVAVKGRFHRSVSLTRDWSGSRDLSEYIVTPGISSIADQILSELSSPSGTRAWSLTGPYGTGKSAFALFLADVLATKKPHHEAGKLLRSAHAPKMAPLLPMLVQGERAPLLPLLLASIASEGKSLGRAVAGRAKRLLGESSHTGDAVATLLLDACLAAKKNKLGGIALIVDEFGKYLEFASAEKDTEDVFVLQQLAEAASRSKVPFLFITVLHSGFADYLAQGDELRRAEWQKVQGRFRDLPFQLPADQMLGLVAHAIESKFANGIDAAYQKRATAILDSSALRDALSRGQAGELLQQSLPLHPLVGLTLWPLFRSKVAQNERSLFAFLTSSEPYGFQDFLVRSDVSKKRSPMYGLADLYDYVSTSLGLATYTGADSRKWALIKTALQRVPAEAPPLSHDVVKAIGLLMLYGAAAGLKPSEAVLRLAFDDRDGFSETLDLLKDESIVLFRRHSDSYGLWEGSDLDLEAVFEEAREKLLKAPLFERLRRAIELRPYVARSHYIKTGTLRYFEGAVVSPSGKEAEQFLSGKSLADGRILFVVDERGVEPDRAAAFTRALSDKMVVLVACPREHSTLTRALLELESWQWVRDHVPELEGDPVARQEVVARLEIARSEFENVAGRIFGLGGHALDPSACDWYYRGSVKKIESPRDFQAKLSQIFENLYAEAPVLKNELLNRHNLSSAAAKARRVLIEAMVEASASERLGIAGYPPEYSMYQAVLVAGGFHAGRGGKWSLRAPTNPEWKPVWKKVAEFIKSTASERRPLTDLADILRAPPIGLRDGPIPVIIAAALVIKGHEVALYEDGVFVPEITIEYLERYLRRPETFELQSYRLTAPQKSVLASLMKLTGSEGKVKNAETAEQFLSIVKELVRMVSELPPYAKQTRAAASPTTVAVRGCLLGATDPKALLFDELPKALDVDISKPDGVKKFSKSLKKCTVELTRVYPNLLESVDAAIVSAFSLPEGGEVGRAAIQKRASLLVDYTTDPRLQVFVKEAARDDKRDWREVLGRATADGKPTTHWRDVDKSNFAMRLQSIATEFDRLEELVAATGNEPAASVLSIAVLDRGKAEKRVVLSCGDGVGEEVELIAKELRSSLKGIKKGSMREKMLALARVAREITEELDEENV